MAFESINSSDKPLGYAQSAAVDAATALSTLSYAGVAGIPAGTARLIIQPQTQAIRWRDDGIDPTTAVGYPLAVGAELNYTGRNFTSIKVISQVAGAIVNVVAYGT